jgi:hypothetical protein
MDPNDITSAISGLANAAPLDSSGGPQAPSPAQNTAPVSTSAQTSAPAAQPNPNAPHAGLRNILQSLFEGMDAFATSAATGGREGGVEEVERINNARKELAMKQQANQREQEDHATRQKMANANLLMATAQYHHNLQMYPIEERNAALDLNNKATAAYNDAFNAGYDFQDPAQAAAWGNMQSRVIRVAFGPNQDPNEVMAGTRAAAEKNGGSLVDYVPMVHYNDAKHGTGGEITLVPSDGLKAANATPRQIAAVMPEAKSSLMQATAAFGADNPDVQRYAGRLQAMQDALQKGGNISAYDLQQFKAQFLSPMSTMIGGKGKADKITQEAATALKAKQDADPLFKLENDPSEMAGEKSSAAISVAQAKIANPTTTPEDKIRATRILAQATNAHNRFMQDQVQKANAEQQAKQGDPKAAGAMLASGDLTLTDMKTRGMTPKFIMDTVTAAKAVDPKYNPADEMAAENVAKSPTQSQFFGSANSLIAKGGTLDQVVDAGSKLPNFKLPIFNKLADAQNYAMGHPEVAAYMQTALGAADDYAKVLGGGTGTEGMQMHILNAMNASQNQTQRAAVVNAMKNAVNSQVTERIGTNKFLMRRYGYALPQNQPAAAPAPAGATMKVPGSDGKMHWSDGKQDLGVVQ